MQENHPSVLQFRSSPPSRATPRLSLEALRALAVDLGADDAGAVRVDRAELDGDRAAIAAAMPGARSVLCIVKRMSMASVQASARSLANNEFHAATDEVGEIGRRIVTRLADLGIVGLNTSAGFPMEMQEFPGRTWVVSHKVVAEAAGLGKMGIHRNVIHPKFGNFILLNSILLDCDLDEESLPIDYSPCFECKLCVSVCPVGAIGSDGYFDAVACLNHNYREFMGGFIDWVDTLTDSKNKNEYQKKLTDQETASWWQSLSTGPNYKSAYCMAACPAGDDIIGRFLMDKSRFIKEVVKPLQQKVEPVYVVKGSDAEAAVMKRFPNKEVRRISSGIRPRSIAQLLDAMPLAFQRGQAKGVDLSIDFEFVGKEHFQSNFTISYESLRISPGSSGSAKLWVRVDSQAWLNFLAKRATLAGLIVRGKLKFKGDIRLLAEFGKCFPS